MKVFTIRLLLLTALVVATGAALRATGHSTWVHPRAGALVAFYTGLTYLTYALVERGRRAGAADLTGYYMGGLMARLLLSMGVAVVFILSGAAGRSAFLAAFFTLYFLYAGFEVWHIVRNLRPNSE